MGAQAGDGYKPQTILLVISGYSAGDLGKLFFYGVPQRP